MIEQFTSPVAVNNSQEPWLVGEGVVVSGGVAIPSLDFNFITGGLPGTVTFTRASTATYFNSSGVLTSAAINEARFDYNPSTLAAQGLLIEEQRTNLALYSAKLDQFSSPPVWTLTGAGATLTATTDIAAPDGTMTAWTLTSSGASAQIQQSTTVVTSTTYTGSLWIRRRSGTGTINIRVVENVNTPLAGVTSQWQRFNFTATSTSTTGRLGVFLSGTSDAVDIWGAQLEAGAFPTSYIPTTVAQVTRSADVASVNTLSPWYNASEGTLFADAATVETGTTSGGAFVLNVSDGTGNNLHRIFRQSDAQPVMQTLVGGVAQSTFGFGATWTDTASRRLAYAYKINDFAGAVNAGTVQTDTAGTLPTVSQMDIGCAGAGTQLNGYLRRIVYYPRRLSNAELVSLTT